MGIFWLLFGWLFIVSLFRYSEKPDTQRAIQTTLSGLGLWLPLALRSPHCGVDLIGRGIGYVGYFERVANTSWNNLFHLHLFHFEKGWTVLNRIIAVITSDRQVFLAIIAAIGVALVSYTIYKYATNVLVSFVTYACLGLYIFSFSGIRQATAIAVTFFAAHFLLKENKNQLIFAALVLIASSFHSSAIIFLAAWPLSLRRLNREKGFIMLVFLLGALPFLSSIINFLTPILFGTKYGNYENEGGAFTMFAVYTVIYISSLMIEDEENPNKLSFYRFMLLSAAACQSLGLISNGAMTRIGYYFCIFYALYVPYFINLYFHQTSKIISFVAVTLLIVFFYLTTSGGYLNVVPYYFFWER